MLSLVIDTSYKSFLLAIYKDNEPLIINRKSNVLYHSDIAMNSLIQVFNDANIKIDDINNIIVCNGPGSFTGIRIGVTIAKVIANFKDVKLYSVDTLKATALSYKKKSNLITVLKGVKDEYYVSIFNNEKRTIKIFSEESLNKLIDTFEDYEVISVNESDKFKHIEIESKKLIENIKLLNIIKKPRDLNPLYIKKTQAEMDYINGKINK